MISILVVEDDYLIGHAVEQWLVKEGRVQWAQSIASAQMMLDDTDFDIILTVSSYFVLNDRICQ